MEPSKKWYLSKTVWMQVVALVAVVVPQSQEFLKEYFAEAGAAWAAINFILRLVTKDKLSIS